MKVYKLKYLQNGRSGKFDEVLFSDFEKARDYVVKNFLDWFFEQEIIQDSATFEEVADSLDYFRETNDWEDMFYTDVFKLNELEVK